MTNVQLSPTAIELRNELDPVEAVEAIRELPGVAFLDSSWRGGSHGRYTYLAAEPSVWLRSWGNRLEITRSGERSIYVGDPLNLLLQLIGQRAAYRHEGLPPFQGGAIGFISYDFGRSIETIPSLAVDDLGMPEVCVGLYDWVIAWDHLIDKVWLIVAPANEARPGGDARIAWLLQRLSSSQTPRPLERLGTIQVSSNFTRAAYLSAITHIKRRIAAGETYQINLSQRFSGRASSDAWSYYRRLRTVCPAPYSAFLEFGNITILSASPESFLQFDGQRLTSHPIKGTRRRGLTPELDRRAAEDLAASEKDRAENLMIVDLLRNDLGKVCQPGSITVPSLFAIEGYSHVWQMVSTIAGEVRPGTTAFEILRACFPGGSVTGCPKVRAMTIIDTLEPTRRGVYCGAIGWFGYDGAMATNIAIRTIVLKDRQAYLQAGGAIVADSDPDAEYDETLAKAAGPLAALDAEIVEA